MKMLENTQVSAMPGLSCCEDEEFFGVRAVELVEAAKM